MLKRFRNTSIVIATLLLAVLCHAQDMWQTEADRLAPLLNWKHGDVVAEIGAGAGKFTALASERVGPTGKVYSTELDKKSLANLNALAAKNTNIVVVKAAETETNLPPACCDSIFMRDVYHHFTAPVEMDRSLFRSLKSGGLLAVIDMNPRPGTTVPDGVPANREGHGIPQKLLIKELTDAGFVLEKVDDSWPNRDLYCVVFRKPKQ